MSRYDWSDPSTIRWTVVESSYGGGGTGVVRIAPRTRGGSRLFVEWDNVGGRGLQKPLLLLLHRGPMGHVIARLWTSALDRFADSGGQR